MDLFLKIILLLFELQFGYLHGFGAFCAESTVFFALVLRQSRIAWWGECQLRVYPVVVKWGSRGLHRFLQWARSPKLLPSPGGVPRAWDEAVSTWACGDIKPWHSNSNSPLMNTPSSSDAQLSLVMLNTSTAPSCHRECCACARSTGGEELLRQRVWSHAVAHVFVGLQSTLSQNILENYSTTTTRISINRSNLYLGVFLPLSCSP